MNRAPKKHADPDCLNFNGFGYPRAMDGEEHERGEASPGWSGATELLLSVAERVDGEIADEAILADLYELRERAYSALLSLDKRDLRSEADRRRKRQL